MPRYTSTLAIAFLLFLAGSVSQAVAQDQRGQNSSNGDRSVMPMQPIGDIGGAGLNRGRAVSGQPAQPPQSSKPTTPNPAAQQPTAPEISITVDSSGKLIIQSDDPAALDRLEKIMRTNRPPQKPYDVFEVKYARATWIKLNLVEYFEENDDGSDWQRMFFGFDFGDTDKDKERQLGSRPPLRFIADNDTNSIVVIGADDFDRQTIRDLIKLWDVPEPEDDVDDGRYTELVPVKYSRADSIAATLKEAYRDLLSANDKAFQGGDGEESKRDSGGSDVGFSLSFKGKLSLGVDNVTNSILVSAEGQQLLKVIKDMIELLDNAAKTESEIAVARVPVSMNNDSVREALMKMFASQKPDKNKQAQQQQEQQQQEQQAQQQAQQQMQNSQRGRNSRPRR